MNYPYMTGYTPPPRDPGAPPKSVRDAVTLIYAVVGLKLAGGLITIVLMSSELDAQYEGLLQSLFQAFFGGLLLLVLLTTIIGAGLWFGMAYVNGKGYPAGRIAFTVIFGIAVVRTITAVASGGLAGLWPWSWLAGLVELAAGGAALYFLWQPESTSSSIGGSRRKDDAYPKTVRMIRST